jgi:hypothetical protein
MPNEVVLISHPNMCWPKARNLHTSADGWLLVISHRPLFDGCARLLEEQLCDADTMVMILDCNDAAAPICGRVSDVLGIARLAA